MKFKLIYLFIALFLIGNVSAFFTNTFNNSLTNENFTINSSGTYRYLAIPSTISALTIATFNFTYPSWASQSYTSAWSFDETGYPLRINDTKGIMNLTANNTVIRMQTGKLNNAIRVNNSVVNALVNSSAIPNSFKLDKNPFTLAFWVNASSGDGGTGYQLFGFGGASATTWSVGTIASYNNITFATSSVATLTTPNYALNGSYNRIVFVREGTGSNQFKVYINNNNTANTTLSGNFSDITTNPFVFGTANGVSTGFNLDDVRIYNGVAWSVTDVNNDWNNGQGVQTNTGVGNLNLTIGGVSLINDLTNASGINQTYKLNALSLVNNYLNGCTIVNNYCLVPFLFNSSIQITGGYSYLNFSNIAFNENSQTFNNQTFEINSETFRINITYDNSYYSSIAGTLVYNNTRYAGTPSGSGSERVFSSTLTTPAISSQTNITFHWEISLSNSTSTDIFNSTFYNQSISNLGIDDCSVNTILLLNYTFYDEDTPTSRLTSPTYNNTFEITATLGTFDQLYYNNISFNKTGINPVRVCISASILNTTNYRLDAEVKYSSTDRVQEYHNIQNMSITNSSLPQQINLYPLLNTNSQEFLITFKDSNFVPRENVLIDIVRRYTGTGQSFTVEIPKTDHDGRTIGHFVLNDVVYDIYVRQYGVLIATFNNIRAFCSNIATGDCRLNLNAGGSSINPSSYLNFKGLDYTSSWNKTTSIYDFDFIILDSTTKTLNLTITKWDNYNNVILCSTALTTSSGTLECDLSSYSNISAIAKIYVNGELLSTSSFEIGLSRNRGFGNSPMKYLLAFIIIITLPFLAITSAPMTILMVIIGFVLIIGINLIEGGGFFGALSGFIWIVIAGMILLWKATRGRTEP